VRRETGFAAIATAALALGLAAASVPPAVAVTKLEGEYNLQLDIRKQDRAFEWDFDSNNNDTFTQASFRLFSQPRPGVEAFVKYEAEWNTSDNNGERPMFFFREGHGRYRFELNGGKKGFDSYLFSRQSRFWVDNYLIQVVRDGEANDGGNAQGVRVESWGFLGGVNATAIVSDYSGQYDPTQVPCADCSGDEQEEAREERRNKTDDGYVLRLRRTFGNNRLRTGLTMNRKVENQDGFDQENDNEASVVAGDVRYTFKDIDFSLEYAQSHTVGAEPGIRFEDGLDQEILGITMPNSAVMVGEIRTLRAGNARLGYFNAAPLGWFRGPTFDNRMGDSNRDERGYLINTWYLVPARAITLTNNWLQYEKFATLQRKVTEYYGEAYIEFINGFTGKAYYRQRRTADTQADGSERLENNDDAVFWLSVESQLAWFRLSGKVKNIDTAFQKELVSIEASVNLGTKTKLYTRLVSGNDPTSLRRSLFSQIQYRPAGNMELFVEYGPGYIGDAPLPVDDGDLEGSGRQKDIIKVFLKGTF
jgi:hypothetical protein